MNKKQKLEKLATAARALETARLALADVAGDSGDSWYICGDAAYYANQIQELLSSDDGECGLDSLISLVEKDL